MTVDIGTFYRLQWRDRAGLSPASLLTLYHSKVTLKVKDNGY